MSIKQIDLFHGSVLSKITRNESNKISLIEWSEKENRAMYKVETEHSRDVSIFIKYATSQKNKNTEKLTWNFTNLSYRENCLFCFVCIEDKVIDGDTVMEICAINQEKLHELFTREEIDHQQTISCVVKLEKRKAFRVNRQHKGIELIIPRNEIDKV